MGPKTRKEKFKNKLLSKYRLVILNENTFEEQVSFKLSRLNVFAFMLVTSLLLIVGTIFLIAFSPLKEYIPGYSSTALMKQANQLSYQTDSILSAVSYNEKYYEAIKKVLKGDVAPEDFSIDSIDFTTTTDIEKHSLHASKEDLVLRSEIDNIEKYSLTNASEIDTEYLFFPPVKGKITSDFDIKSKHFAVDIAVDSNVPIMAASNGMVVFAEWNPQTGNVIVLKHSSGIISVYKHNDKLLKSQGETVHAGEAIAIAGNTGELSTGPHLHFELWDKDVPLNPTEYIDFQK